MRTISLHSYRGRGNGGSVQWRACRSSNPRGFSDTRSAKSKRAAEPVCLAERVLVNPIKEEGVLPVDGDDELGAAFDLAEKLVR